MFKISNFLIGICVAAIFFASSALAQGQFDAATLDIETGTGTKSFKIEVAANEVDRSRGLMFRRSLQEDAGMLFVYRAPREITMWMKSTFISLDMIFIGADNKIANIATNTEPHSLKVISSIVPARYVLELAAGSAKAKGLKIGQTVSHPLLQK